MAGEARAYPRKNAEVSEKKRATELYEEKRRKLLEANKLKEEQILMQNKEKKDQLEEKWAMARWLA